MPKLAQVVAIEKGTKDSTNKETAPLFHDAKKPALFAGVSKTYETINEDGERLPDDSTRVQLTVPQVLAAFAKPTTKLIDVLLTKENANTEAFADVKVNGEVLIEQAPVSFLLQFERMLTQEVRGLIVSLPTLDPAYEWTPSDASEAGVYETEVTKRGRTKKVQKPIVLYPATDKHAAQTQLITEDELVGYWSEKKFSGAISAARKQELLDRVDTLIAAVKFAREEANSRDVEMKAAGAQIFAHLFA